LSPVVVIMNRKDLQRLANVRLVEAKQLLKSKNPSGAYYLAGYSIELALKLCIAKKTKRYDFPNLNIVKSSYTHDLKNLIKLAGLEKKFRYSNKS
jgi:HEPN domain-containing protein